MMNMSLLIPLKPNKKQMIIDLVSECGIDVSHWSFKKNGEKVKYPQSNSRFCYEWAFGGRTEPYLFCIWYESLECIDGAVCFCVNLRKKAIRHEAGSSPGDKQHAKKSRNFDRLLEDAFKTASPVRVVIVDNEHRPPKAHSKGSTVQYRMLDKAHWYVRNYDVNNGDVVLERS